MTRPGRIVDREQDRVGLRHRPAEPGTVDTDLREESAVAEAPVSPPDRTTGPTVDAATRARLLAILQDELTRASSDAQARGMPAEALAAQLDERITRLRAQTTEMSKEDS